MLRYVLNKGCVFVWHPSLSPEHLARESKARLVPLAHRRAFCI